MTYTRPNAVELLRLRDALDAIDQWLHCSVGSSSTSDGPAAAAFWKTET